MELGINSALYVGAEVVDKELIQQSVKLADKIRKERLPVSEYIARNGLEIRLGGKAYTYVYYGYGNTEYIRGLEVESEYYQLVEYGITDMGDYVEICRYNLFLVEKHDCNFDIFEVDIMHP